MHRSIANVCKKRFMQLWTLFGFWKKQKKCCTGVLQSNSSHSYRLTSTTNCHFFSLSVNSWFNLSHQNSDIAIKVRGWLNELDGSSTQQALLSSAIEKYNACCCSGNHVCMKNWFMRVLADTLDRSNYIYKQMLHQYRANAECNSEHSQARTLAIANYADNIKTFKTLRVCLHLIVNYRSCKK